MKITTNELERTLQNDIQDNYVELTNEYKLLLELLHNHMQEKKITRAEIIRNLNLGLTNGYKYFDGQLTIKRDHLIACLILFELNIDEIQEILKKYNYKYLYVKNKRDQIIYNCICNNMNLEQINKMLSKNECLRLC